MNGPADRAFFDTTVALRKSVRNSGSQLVDGLKNVRVELLAKVKDTNRLASMIDPLTKTLQDSMAQKRGDEIRLRGILDDLENKRGNLLQPTNARNSQLEAEDLRRKIDDLESKIKFTETELRRVLTFAPHAAEFTVATDQVATLVNVYCGAISSAIGDFATRVRDGADTISRSLIEDETSRLGPFFKSEIERVERDINAVFAGAIAADNINAQNVPQDFREFAITAVQNLKGVTDDTVRESVVRIKDAFADSIAAIYIDSRFGSKGSGDVLGIYFLKLARVGTLYASQIVSVKMFINIYNESDKKKRTDLKLLPVLFTFVCFALDIIIATVLRSVIAVTGGAVPHSLFDSFVYDTLACYVFTIATLVPVCDIIQSRKYFDYDTMGARGIRVAGHVCTAVGAFHTMLPYFNVLADFFKRITPLVNAASPRVS
jgi:hypothetical protein